MKIDLSKQVKVDEYEQTRVPDKTELARLLQEAKGPGRNMATFAKECGSSASTFSRILNCKISQPVDPRLLKAIAENSDEESVDEKIFMLHCLLHANGMLNEEDIQEKKEDPFWSKYFEPNEELFSEENEAKNIITMNLLNRGLGIKYLASIKKESGVNEIARENRRGGFVIQIDGHTPDYHIFCAICLNKTRRISRGDREDQIDKETGYEYQTEAELLFRDEAVYFLLDAWEPESFQKVKYSLVFTDPKFYRAFYELLAKRKVNSWISLILVDLATQSVVEENIMSRHDNQTLESLFNMPVMSAEVREDDE